jgi:tetratricopeptide (TPR) repeat protein
VSEAVKSDFFLSRRGSVAAIAREVTDVLTERGYAVVVQDYDILLTANFVEAMHEAIKNSRDLIVLFTADYETSPHTRREFTSFDADRALSGEERRVVILRCEDVPLRGLFASNVYQDLVGVDDPQERRQRIIAAAEGRSQAQRPPPRPFVGVPPRIASFTGRVAELELLDAILVGSDKPAAITQVSANVGRAALQGLGGVGKTSLAVEYAYRYRDLYAGVWWCPAENNVDLLTGLASLARHLGAAAADEIDLEKAAKAGLRRLAEQRAKHLLIYDNVTSPDEIADLLPAAGAKVLITSRFPDWGGWAQEVGVDVLPMGEAVAFLEARGGRHDSGGARTLAEMLGRLPLALDHAAAYCRRTQTGFVEYAAKAASLIAAAPRGSAYPRSVAATFDLAITAAVASCPMAEALMAYLGYCAPERITMALIAGAIEDEAQRMVALLALGDVSLVRCDPFEDGTAAWTVHRLVQAAARARAGSATAGERVVARLATVYPVDGFNNPASWPLCEQLMPHLLARCARPRGNTVANTDVATLLHRAAEYFHARAAHAQARPLFERALAIFEDVLGPEHCDTAVSLNALAYLLQAQGDLAAARPLFERALAIFEKVLGPEHPHTAISLITLGSLLEDQGDLSGARSLCERALAIQEKVLGPEHPDIATCLNNLGHLLLNQGDLASARSLYERALVVYEKALAPEHPYTATCLSNLGKLLLNQGDLAGAQPFLERALAIHEKVAGPEHPNTAFSVNTLASLQQAQGDLAAARQLFERALAIFEKVLGPEHPHTALTINALASLLQAQGDLAAARPLFERALAIHEKAHGAAHPNTATSLSNLARLMNSMEQTDKAEPMARRAVAIGEAALGPEHPATQRFQSNLARMLLDTGRRDEALKLAETALAVHVRTHGLDSAWTRDSARVVADALDVLGRSTEGTELRARYSLQEKG